MRKSGIAVYAGIVVSVALVSFARPGWTNSKVTVETNGCLEAGCHSVGVFGANDGSIHGSHSNCADCHEGTPQAGNVFSSSCLACHPNSDSELCDLARFMENSLNYNPTGLSCYECHSNCEPTGTTTTTTATGTSTTTTTPQISIKGKRFEIFLIGPFREGCRATTVEFRSDNVLVLDCLDGFGTYWSIGNVFSAVYWSNNYYLGYGLGMIISGFAFDSYIFAGGIAYFEHVISTVALSGYVL